MTISPSIPIDCILAETEVDANPELVIPEALISVLRTIDPIVIETILKILLHVGSLVLKASGMALQKDTMIRFTLASALASCTSFESEDSKMADADVPAPRTTEATTLVLEKHTLPDML
jgi:hypothetical protein